ncbi:MAG TPA: DEAD/DEAH box helicase family protein [Methanocorpusculum sp.]|nr:DEAD/DEAH box helicase family protein [Methanocorpusculum sp.]
MNPLIIPPDQPRTEEDEKRLHITRAIENAGWGDNDIWMEFKITDGLIVVRDNVAAHEPGKTADYLLARNSHALAIVEAKKYIGHSVGSGMQQALAYAELLDIPFAYSSNGEGFLEHDRLADKNPERELALSEFPSPDELWKRFCGHKNYSSDIAEKIAAPYYYDLTQLKEPRYYQRIAIDRTVDAVVSGQYPGGINKRILLVMATGSGKTYTAFQIIHRLKEAKVVKNVLYLADRNVLIDQTMKEDFKPFSKMMVKVSHKQMTSEYEIYMSLYQQQAACDADFDTYKNLKPDFFDLIIVDECHRGSADANSAWRRILEYFSGAVQIGMTATPKENDHVSNSEYFGNALYTYSLKQGIEDGFLAPYKVIRVDIDKDLLGWRPRDGQKDRYGKPIADKVYKRPDFDKELVLDERTQLVAHRIVQELETIGRLSSGRFKKTMVFCDRIEHAERMRQALVNEIGGEASSNSKYVVDITGESPDAKADLENFNDPYSEFPVIATTSDLLTTGVNCKTCELIALDKTIASANEFKQIIGRGTRLYPPSNKMYFTILDFKDATSLFADPGFMGDPIKIYKGSKERKKYGPGNTKDAKVYRVNDVPVEVLSETVQYYSPGGKLVVESFTDFTRNTIRGKFATLDEFLKHWNAEDKEKLIAGELELHDVFLHEIRRKAGNPNMDDFDLLCHIAYGIKPLTRGQRANKVRDGKFFEKYQGVCRTVLNTILDNYQDGGDVDIASINVLKIPALRKINSPMKIIAEFGGTDNFLGAVAELRSELYSKNEAA